MAFDSVHHTVDPVTGYHIHKATWHRVGIDPAPIAKHPEAGSEYPKWVTPHPGHVMHHPLYGHVSTPHFSDASVDRDGTIKVRVEDADEEAKALADPNAQSEPA